MFTLYADPAFADVAREVAGRFGFVVALREDGDASRPRGAGAEEPCLELDATGLSFRDPASRLRMRVDYLRGPSAYRLFAVGNSHEPLLVALGLNKGELRRQGVEGESPRVLDAGAGLGRDGMVIAAAGAQVLMCERSPVMAALLADGLARAAADAKLGPMARERLALHFGDAREILAAHGAEFAAVYFDPMFPERAKAALVKKEMRLARLISGDDADAAEILALARAIAPLVVVKRPLHAPALAPGARRSVNGTRVRYDVY